MTAPWNGLPDQPERSGNYKKISLSQGKFALVDAEDYDFLCQWKWHADKDGQTFYALRNRQYPNGKRRKEYMHRLINSTPKGFHTDHINGNGLDNRRKNLRTCTCSENQMNRRMQSKSYSGIRGINWHSGNRLWVVRLKRNGKIFYGGSFKNIEDAKKVHSEMMESVFEDYSPISALTDKPPHE